MKNIDEIKILSHNITNIITENIFSTQGFRMQIKKTTVLYFLLTLSYFFSYFFRISTSVVLPIIQAEWEISAAIIGFISSMYFYTYAIFQPFCGILNDQYGPIRIVTIGIIITMIGSLCFGFGNNVLLLIVGRLLMGIGLSPMLSGLLVYQSQSFPAEKYTFFSGFSMTIGNFGAVVSVAPLSFALAKWGKEYVFLALSITMLVITILLFFLGKNSSIGQNCGNKTFKTMLKSRSETAFYVIKKSNSLKIIIIDWLIIFGGLMAFQGLWAISWFRAVYPNNKNSIALAASMIGFGIMAGNFFGGNIGKTAAKRHIILKIITLLNFLMWLGMLWCFYVTMSLYITMSVSFILGIINGIAFVQFTAAVNEISPIGSGGSVFGITNFCTFTSVIFFQWCTGIGISRLSIRMPLPETYIRIFFIITVCMIIPAFITSQIKSVSRVD